MVESKSAVTGLLRFSLVAETDNDLLRETSIFRGCDL